MSHDLKDRTKRFALRIMKMIDTLPNTVAGRAIANQIVRSGTSVGANYRAACRGRSTPEFIAKLGIVLEEVDECGYWMELIMESGMIKKELVEPLHQEANELTAIVVASINTAKSKQEKKNKN